MSSKLRAVAVGEPDQAARQTIGGEFLQSALTILVVAVAVLFISFIAVVAGLV